jgi:tRNA-Thr(GGU) m(6)t(6)A37 methyltransferase TsaA
MKNIQKHPMELIPVGVIHTPFQTLEKAPHQGRFSETECTIEISDRFSEGLQDIEHSPFLILLYWLDRADRTILKAIPPHDPDRQVHGVFATRSPNRPNPIGICVVKLLHRDRNRLIIKGIDALDGTPLIDIKPYSAGIDCIKE